MVRRLATAGTLVLAAGLLASCSATAHASLSTDHTAASKPCAGAIGVMLPYGGASERDSVQTNWARVALDEFNNAHGTSFTIVPENVDTSSAEATAGATKLAGDKRVVGVVGPATSVAVDAAGPILDAAGLTFVSPSATRATLTDGRFSHFFRVVPNDSVQGPSVAKFVSSKLSPTNVLVVSDPESYSQDLTASIASHLKKDHVAVDNVTIDLENPNPDDVVAAMTPQTDVVILDLLQPEAAKSVADAIEAQGLNPAIVATDSMFSLTTFNVPGAFVSSFAPDFSAVSGNGQLERVYRSIFGDLAPFGGPSYVAMDVVLSAALRSCVDGVATRPGVAREIAKTDLERTILGEPLSFDAHGDVVNGRFFMFRIEGERFVEQH